ncbi:hypothetical protein HKBW3C_02589, partial [Candidatus Hakubella thermalkaliphila]
DILPLNNLDTEKLLALAGAVEFRSEHPLAEAIVRRANEASALIVIVNGLRLLK